VKKFSLEDEFEEAQIPFRIWSECYVDSIDFEEKAVDEVSSLINFQNLGMEKGGTV
jgi:hypothetical protein